MSLVDHIEAYLASPEYLFNDGQFRMCTNGVTEYNDGYLGWRALQYGDPGWRSLAKRLSSLLKPFRVADEEENAHPWIHASSCPCKGPTPTAT
ncbi:MAG: hypothetical protein NVS2B16_16430 [Chloroflexota bacterium]